MKIAITMTVLLCSSLMTFAQSVPVYLDESKSMDERIEDALSRMTLQEKIRIIHAQSKFSSAGVPRLGFPDFWTDDGPHGVRPDVLWDEWEQANQTNDSCVAFPALSCLAASWNPQLAYQYGVALGEEARYRDKDMILGPGVNINRTPLCGRNFEYMGEDPFLSGTMAVPYIRGMQSTGVSACIKHFCVNNDEENRFDVNVNVSDRALHEIYLPAFKMAVDSGVWAVMPSYNLYKNIHNCHNPYLINDLLKGDWNFNGVVVSDWGGTHNTGEAVHNGLDMEFGTWTDGLKKGVSNAYDNYFLASPYLNGILSGKYGTKELDDKVRRILRLFYHTTMNGERSQGFLCSAEHYAVARHVATEGIVLLQNKGNILPLQIKQGTKILVVGENAIKMMTVGGGSSSLKAQRELSPLDGLRLNVPQASIDYERGYVGDIMGEYNGVTTGQDLSESRTKEQLIADAVNKAKEADYVIMFGGLNKSDFQDCEGHDRKHYELPYGQDELIEALAAANKRFVYVNISGNAVAMPWRDKVPAIVQAWFLGSEAGNAIADVLTGAACPSGKLTYTWFETLNDVPAHKLGSYPGTWRKGEKIIDEDYSDGIYVGYRSVLSASSPAGRCKPAFAFGHGLSYTSFKLSDLRKSANVIDRSGSLTFTVNVRNTGVRDGSEIVQLYIHDEKSSIDRPYMELKGYKKVFLKAGESADVSMTIDRGALSFYDEANGRWTCEDGTFTALVGDASDNITQKTSFKLK